MEDCYFAAIKIIYGRMPDSIPWAVAGSTNMLLQGMPIEPHDLDVVVHRKNLEKVSSLFADYAASPVNEFKGREGKPVWDVRAGIEGTNVQFFGGDEADVYVGKLLAGRTVLVKMDGIDVPCLALEAEAQAYRETNRKHKSDMIEEFLRTRV